MSKRMKINASRLVHLRTSPRQLQVLTAFGTVVQQRANDDFNATAAHHEIAIMAQWSHSKVPYDITARTGPDRVRVYVQTANLPARRHERSTRGSSLLRGLKAGG
jgi:hypothetical protein